MSEVILIVDDEESVRKTFREWLESAELSCRLRVAADAESALLQANEETIDLAVLDWNLGTGSDGLKLLEDLYDFNPDVVAIMVTGYAHQATPLDAMRMGVRDYLDKNQDLDRNTFLQAIRRQLDHIRPAKQGRLLHQRLAAFREEVDKILPLVQSATALNDPVPLPRAIGSLFRFLMRATNAGDAVLLVRSYTPDRQPAEIIRVYDAAGNLIEGKLAPFPRSLAATVVSMQEPCVMSDLGKLAKSGSVILQPFEQERQNVLAAALPVSTGIHVVLELFDKQGSDSFTSADKALLGTAAEFGAELLRHSLAERQAQQMLIDAIVVAQGETESVSKTIRINEADRREEPLPTPVLDRMRESLQATSSSPGDAEDTLRLAEAVRVLSVRHGPAAVRHCIRLVEGVRELLDEITTEG